MADNSVMTTAQEVNNISLATNNEGGAGKSAESDAPAKSGSDAAVEEKTAAHEQETKLAPNELSTTSNQDVEMKDAADSGASAAEVAKTAPETVDESNVDTSAVTATPVTPATAKKSNGGTSTKKKSAGVPEHKSKKLNKKKSKAELHLDCHPGDLFLARMKGHAPWPSIVCDEEILPESLLKSRPVTAALADGSFKREDYAPGGKRQGERTYPIMFLHTNEFAWLPNTDLTPITAEDCKEVEEKGKAKSLIAAYGVAAEGHDIQHYKTMLGDHQAAVQEDLDRQAEKEAEKEAAKAAKAENAKAAKAEKKVRRKSAPAAKDEDDNDDMEVDQDGETQKSKSKKRKKAVEAEEESEEKPAKTQKLKLNGPKTPSTDKKPPAKPKSSSKKAAAAKKDSDEEMEDAPAAEATPLSAAEIKEKKEKEIRYYRHKLQRSLLSRDYAPSDDEVESASGWLGKLETYPDLDGEIIRNTKIHKVLRAMIRLPSIPMEEKYDFKKRSNDLLQKWNSTLGSDGGDAEGNNERQAKATAETSATNTEDDKKVEKKSESIQNASSEVKAVEKKESSAVTDSDNKLDGKNAAKESKNEAPEAAERVSEAAKTAPAEGINGVAKEVQPAAPSTAQSEAPKNEEKPAESIETSIEASS